jgi:hypothetical protein
MTWAVSRVSLGACPPVSVMVSDSPGEVRERHEARQKDGAKLRVVLHPAVERQGVKERIQGHGLTSSLRRVRRPCACSRR